MEIIDIKRANSINSDLYRFSHTFLLKTSGLPNQNIAWAALQSHIKRQHKQTLSPFPFPQFKELFFLFTGRIYFDPTSDFHYCENKQLRLTKKCFKDTQQVFISYFFLTGSLSVCWSRFFRILFSSSRLSSVQFILSNSFQKNSS